MRWPRRCVRWLAIAAALGAIGAEAGAAVVVPPATVALALDTSGSVGPEHLLQARVLALSILAGLPEGSEVSVLAFDDQSRVVVPRTADPASVRARLAELKVGGRFTALHDALYDASRYVREAPGARRAIVLVTDGLDENSALDLEDGLRVATEAQIPVFAVGVGPRPQERVLRRIAKLTGGDYLPLGQARGGEIAARIAALPAGAPPVAASPPSAGAGRPPTSRPVAAPPASRAAASPWLLWLAWALAVAALAALVTAARRHRRAEPQCPSCGGPRPEGAETCADCAAAPTRIAPRPSAGKRDKVPDLSETVLARMNATEEYLEKTITLQERPVLAITRGPGAGQVFELSALAATSIGRSRANDIRVEDVSISGQHCRIRPEEGHFVLHDLRSTNGTLVNDRKVVRHVLAEGDVISIGETSLQYRREMKRQ